MSTLPVAVRTMIFSLIWCDEQAEIGRAGASGVTSWAIVSPAEVDASVVALESCLRLWGFNGNVLTTRIFTAP